MLLGSSTGHILQVVTSATADIEVSGSVIAVSTATPPVVDGSVLGPVILASITTATTTAVVTGATSLIKRVMELSLRNNHASTTCDVTLQRTDGTNTDTVVKATLLAGEALVYNGASWLHYDTNGAIYPSVGNAATQAEMEAGTATNKYVTPQGVNWHPGVAKAWGVHALSAGVPQMTATWNVTSVTDSAVCRVTPVIATDFSTSTGYVILYGAQAATTTYSATTTALAPIVRNATPTVTQFTLDLLEFDIGQTTDPAAWYWAAFGDQA